MGSQPACAWSDVALAQLLSTPLPDGLRFFPRPIPASPSVRLTAHFPWRERDGLTTFRTSTIGCVRLYLFAGGATSAGDDAGASPPGHLPFGPSLSAPLACWFSRRLSVVHFRSPCHPTLAPDRLRAGSRAPALMSDAPPCE